MREGIAPFDACNLLTMYACVPLRMCVIDEPKEPTKGIIKDRENQTDIRELRESLLRRV